MFNNPQQYDPQMQMLSTNMLLNLRTGNPIYDTIMSVVLMTVVLYVMQFKTLVMVKCKQLFRRCFRHRYRVRYEGHVYANNRFTNDTFSETFVAVNDWVIAGIRNNEFDRVHTLCEIQLPRAMGNVMDSCALLHGDDQPHARRFNHSTMLLEQPEQIRHKTLDIYVHHESYKQGGSGEKEDGLAAKNDYTVHTITFSSDSLTTNELVDLVHTQMLQPFQERRRQREKDKLFYYLFDKHDMDDEHPSYEKYLWTSTKTFDHVKSEQTELVKRRVDHFLNNRAWYEKHGKPYSLTILLYGPPGCGKTSMAKAIAKHCRRNLKDIPLPRVKNRRTLMDIFHSRTIGFSQVNPEDCVLVFEEFDKMGDIVNQRKEYDEEVDLDNDHHTNANATDERGESSNPDDSWTLPRKTSNTANTVTSQEMDRAIQKAIQDATASTVALSSSSYGPSAGGGLDNNYHKSAKSNEPPPLSVGDILTVMDGLLENNGIITIFTANNIDHLHKALIRPGRIDMKVRMDKATTKSLKDIVQMVHGADPNVQELLEAISDDDPRYHKRWSPAEVEEACFQGHPYDTVEGALEVLGSRGGVSSLQ